MKTLEHVMLEDTQLDRLFLRLHNLTLTDDIIHFSTEEQMIPEMTLEDFQNETYKFSGEVKLYRFYLKCRAKK